MMAEGLYLLPGEEEQHERAREAWIKAERAALEAARQRSKNSAEIVHNLICECGCEHLIRLTVTVGNPAQHIERPDSRVRADAVDRADCALNSESQHFLPSFKPQDSILKVFHSLLRRLVGSSDGKARAGVGQGGNPAPRPDALPSSSTKSKREAA